MPDADHMARQRGAPLRVLLDARKLLDGGIGKYIQNLARGLALRGDVSLGLVLSPRGLRSPQGEEFKRLAGVSVIEDRARPYSLDEMFCMPRRIDFGGYDLYHAPHYTLPYGVPLPAVVTIHDLIQISHPQRFYYPAVASFLIRSAARRAARVLTVSRATFQDLTVLLGRRPADTDKLRVVPNAVDPFFLRECLPQPYLNEHFRIGGRFLLTVCSMNKPHKGLKGLMAAFGAVKDRLASGSPLSAIKLVLAGRGVAHLAAGEGEPLHRDIIALGEVGPEALLHLYAGAEALVVPSLAEGFCLPVLEARAQGAPIITRPIPAVVELAGKDDVVCADFSAAALESALARFLEGGPRRGARAAGAPERLAPYLQERVVQQTVDVYLEALGAGG